MPTNISRHSNDALEKRSPKLFVFFVVQKRNYVTEKYVVGFLFAKKYAEFSDAVLHQRLFHQIILVG